MLSQPALLLLDEPLAALDAARREEVLPYLERLRDNLSIPMVYVSHQFDEVLRLATHVVLMDAGHVVAQGPLSEVSLLPQLRAIVGPDSVGAVVDGVVTSVDASCGMAELRVGSGSLNVSVPTVNWRMRPSATPRPRHHPGHGGTPWPQCPQSASRTITSIADDEDDARLITVDVGGASVLSRVTRRAVEALTLQNGSNVWVLVKAVSTRGHAFRMGTSQLPLMPLTGGYTFRGNVKARMCRSAAGFLRFFTASSPAFASASRKPRNSSARLVSKLGPA